MTSRSWLLAADPPIASHDGVLVDLDGVVYIGEQAIGNAVAGLAKVRQAGLRVVFITNNASRSPELVAERLRGFGVPADPRDVVTSAQAAARLVRDRCGPGSRVLVTGSRALRDEIDAAGLCAVQGADEQPAAVVQGFDPALGYPDLAEAALAVRAGAFWVATNEDSTLPDTRGMLPGNGALVAAVATATGRRPLVAGKPSRFLFEEALRRAGLRNPIVVGDRPETDVAGARAAGLTSLLVLSGVTTPAELLEAPEQQRPTYLAQDLLGLFDEHPPVRLEVGAARCRDWYAHIDHNRLTLRGAGDRLDALRALAACAWQASDRGLALQSDEALAVVGESIQRDDESKESVESSEESA